MKLNLEKVEQPAIDQAKHDNQNIEVQPVERAEIVITEVQKAIAQPDLQETEQQ